MKRNYTLLSVLCLLLISQGHAQEKKVALGLTFSPTVNWWKASSENLSSDGSRIGFKYGLLADFNFGENYALATGIFINNAGGKYNAIEMMDSLQNNVSYNQRLQSVEIPLTLRMRTKEIGYLKYYGQFGFSPELFINSTADVQVEGQEQRADVDQKRNVADLNLSLVLGIGVEYNLSGTTNLLFGLSYQNGFIDVLKGSASSVEKKATTNQIALNLGVLF
ncbi:MAG: porin family protein [Vicingaceae bacterium]